MHKYILLLLTIIPALAFAQSNAFESRWVDAELGVGPDFWADDLQDWRVTNGRLELQAASSGQHLRTVYLLTRRIDGEDTGFNMDVVTGAIYRGRMPSADAFTGFLIGASEDAGGLIAAVDGVGRAFFLDSEAPEERIYGAERPGALPDSVALRLLADRRPSEMRLTLLVSDIKTGKEVSRAVMYLYPPERVGGNVALISNPGRSATRFWYTDWHMDGPSVEIQSDRADLQQAVEEE